MALQLISVRFDATDPHRAAAFWAGMLDRESMVASGGVLLPGTDTQAGLSFTPTSVEKHGPNRVHLHLTSRSLADQQRIVAKALSLGGYHLDVGQLPEEGHVVLADPEGNEFCVMGPDDTFLAGCGEFGEITCEGSPAVGRFWSHALGWPLVWERGEQTAIQAPTGGTKISWDVRTSASPYSDRNQAIQTAATDWDADIERLGTLGASIVSKNQGQIVMSDPDGTAFIVRTIPGQVHCGRLP